MGAGRDVRRRQRRPGRKDAHPEGDESGDGHDRQCAAAKACPGRRCLWVCQRYHLCCSSFVDGTPASPDHPELDIMWMWTRSMWAPQPNRIIRNSAPSKITDETMVSSDMARNPSRPNP